MLWWCGVWCQCDSHYLYWYYTPQCVWLCCSTSVLHSLFSVSSPATRTQQHLVRCGTYKASWQGGMCLGDAVCVSGLITWREVLLCGVSSTQLDSQDRTAAGLTESGQCHQLTLSPTYLPRTHNYHRHHTTLRLSFLLKKTLTHFRTYRKSFDFTVQFTNISLTTETLTELTTNIAPLQEVHNVYINLITRLRSIRY